MRRNSLGMSMALAGMLLASPIFLAGSVPPGQPSTQLEREVRHELIMLPYYGVFDSLSFHVVGDRVVLTGQVVNPVLKSDAGRVVARLAGVAGVDNQIEVLPLSPYDDHVRWGVLRAVYGQSALFRYNMVPVAPIRIIVKHGDVTLEGVVSSQMDKNIAAVQAGSVPGVFSVTNNLQVSKT